MNYKIVSPNKDCRLDISVKENVAEIGFIVKEYNMENIMTSVFMVKKAVDELVVKDVEYIDNIVYKTDWDTVLKNLKWGQIEDKDLDDDLMRIRCDIADYVENFSRGLGLE